MIRAKPSAPSFAIGDRCPACPGSRLIERPAVFSHLRQDEPVAWCAHCRAAFPIKGREAGR